MGIYCIAAGSTTENRKKTLDRPWSVADFEPYLPAREVQKLSRHFPEGGPVFLWGANKQGQLPHVRADEYVIDFNGQQVPHVFQFCFFTSTGSDTRLQQRVGWDEGLPSTRDKRPYPYVYFLKGPRKPHNRSKSFFLNAFAVQDRPHFFDGQKYLDDQVCDAAIERTNSSSLEDLLGLSSAPYRVRSAILQVAEPQPPRPVVVQPSPPPTEPPDWLRPVVEGVQRLWAQQHTLERDHENAVALFLQALGYSPGDEIRFRVSNMDISLAKDGRTLAVIEVKAERSLTATNRVVGQALGYALEAGAPLVIVSNGDYYAIFDRRRGLSRDDSLIAEFRLLALNPAALEAVSMLRKNRLG